MTDLSPLRLRRSINAIFSNFVWRRTEERIFGEGGDGYKPADTASCFCFHCLVAPSAHLPQNERESTLGRWSINKMPYLDEFVDPYKHTEHWESIHTPNLFPHFVTLQPYSKMYFFPHQSTHNKDTFFF
jgi:hypothetical protein